MTVVRRITALALTVVLVLAVTAFAQQAPPMSKEQQAMMEAMTKAATPGPNHKLLEEWAGEWSAAVRMWMDPAAPPTETKGTMSVKPMLGGRYILAEFRANMMGMPFEGYSVNGYDNLTNRFVSFWIDNMSTTMMYTTGTYDAATKTFTYTGEIPDLMEPSTIVKLREVIRIEGPDKQVMEMHETRGGKETKTMEAVYTRVK